MKPVGPVEFVIDGQSSWHPKLVALNLKRFAHEHESTLLDIAPVELETRLQSITHKELAAFQLNEFLQLHTVVLPGAYPVA